MKHNLRNSTSKKPENKMPGAFLFGKDTPRKRALFLQTVKDIKTFEDFFGGYTPRKQPSFRHIQ